VAKVERLYK